MDLKAALSAVRSVQSFYEPLRLIEDVVDAALEAEKMKASAEKRLGVVQVEIAKLNEDARQAKLRIQNAGESFDAKEKAAKIRFQQSNAKLREEHVNLKSSTSEERRLLEGKIKQLREELTVVEKSKEKRIAELDKQIASIASAEKKIDALRKQFG
tara:strand:- start:63 stop:530 length:468 start_codon:yes stop_codon:yes gene_type:complete